MVRVVLFSFCLFGQVLAMKWSKSFTPHQAARLFSALAKGAQRKKETSKKHTHLSGDETVVCFFDKDDCTGMGGCTKLDFCGAHYGFDDGNQTGSPTGAPPPSLLSLNANLKRSLRRRSEPECPPCPPCGGGEGPTSFPYGPGPTPYPYGPGPSPYPGDGFKAGYDTTITCECSCGYEKKTYSKPVFKGSLKISVVGGSLKGFFFDDKKTCEGEADEEVVAGPLDTQTAGECKSSDSLPEGLKSYILAPAPGSGKKGLKGCGFEDAACAEEEDDGCLEMSECHKEGGDDDDNSGAMVVDYFEDLNKMLVVSMFHGGDGGNDCTYTYEEAFSEVAVMGSTEEGECKIPPSFGDGDAPEFPSSVKISPKE